MKTFYTLLIIMSPFYLSSGLFAQQETEKTSHAYPASDTLKFTVYGMDCPGCEGGLEKQVKKIPSVDYAKANWTEQELSIVLKQQAALDTAELKKRVRKANFTLDLKASRDEKDQ